MIEVQTFPLGVGVEVGVGLIISTEPFTVTALGVSSLNKKFWKVKGEIFPAIPTALKFNFSNIPEPLIGSVPNTTTFSKPGVVALQTALSPLLIVPEVSQGLVCGNITSLS